MKAKSSTWVSLLAALVGALPAGAYGAMISGTVTRDGHPVRGALVTVISQDRLVSETVLTSAAGTYRLHTEFVGRLRLRARAPLAADSSVDLDISSLGARLDHRFALESLTTSEEISDSLPPSAHFARIQFPKRVQREQFQADCTPCHQMGNPMTRRPRSPGEWSAIMKAMSELADYQTDVHVADYAGALHQAFNGTPTPDHENTTVDEAALSARIIEWKLPHSKFPHDTLYYPPNGSFYTVDQFLDLITITNANTNRTTVVPIPALGVPIGGSFAGKSGVPDWVPPGVRHGNHSLALSPFDGKLYVTGSVGGEIGVFDPLKVAQTYKVYKIGNAGWPHTIRVDPKGFAWFNLYLTNQIGRFDPRSKRFTLVNLPEDPPPKSNPKAVKRIAATYGLDISPVDGSVWYTKVWANKIGRVDPTTLKVTEWNSPVIGPHRARFDKTGGFWIPGIGDGKVVRLDTRTMKYETYTIPMPSKDEVESPYDLVVDPKTQDVWVGGNQSDRLVRFDPRSKTWTAYPLPTRGLYFRDVVITPQGWACAPSSPIPPEQYKGDGITDSLVCVQPMGNQPSRY